MGRIFILIITTILFAGTCKAQELGWNRKRVEYDLKSKGFEKHKVYSFWSKPGKVVEVSYSPMNTLVSITMTGAPAGKGNEPIGAYYKLYDEFYNKFGSPEYKSKDDDHCEWSTINKSNGVKAVVILRYFGDKLYVTRKYDWENKY